MSQSIPCFCEEASTVNKPDLRGKGGTCLPTVAAALMKMTVVLLGGLSSTAALSHETSQAQANLDSWVLCPRALLVPPPTGPYIHLPALMLF